MCIFESMPELNVKKDLLGLRWFSLALESLAIFTRDFIFEVSGAEEDAEEISRQQFEHGFEVVFVSKDTMPGMVVNRSAGSRGPIQHNTTIPT